jgi:hypothetical protein
MATACCTSGCKGQKINNVASLRYKGNYSHRIRRKTATPEATFLFFSSIFSPFHLFTMNVTRALSLETIKGKAGATSKKTSIRETMTHTPHQKQPHTHHPSKETWDPLPLSKTCNPYYEHSGARQHE